VADTSALRLIHAAVEHLTGLEGQDPMLVIEMSQHMLSDAINAQYHGGGTMRPMTYYVNRYCDVLDSPADADRIATAILDEGAS